MEAIPGTNVYCIQSQELLVGTDEGLHLLEMDQTLDGRQFLHIEGVDGVSVLHSIPELDIILMLTGKEATHCLNFVPTASLRPKIL